MTKMYENKEFMKEWEQENKNNWKKNQQRKRDMFAKV
jgi:hypothetical protein